jgi:hypothetical protein
VSGHRRLNVSAVSPLNVVVQCTVLLFKERENIPEEGHFAIEFIISDSIFLQKYVCLNKNGSRNVLLVGDK